MSPSSVLRTFAAACLLALMIVPAAEAKTFFCDGGDVNCLIAAIQAANAAGGFNTIVLAAGTYTVPSPQTVIDPTGLPVITSTLSIRGEGADETAIERTAPESFRFFKVIGDLTLEDVTLRGGGGPSAFDGGAIQALGPLTLKNVVVTNSEAREGGALEIQGKASIANSSIVGNHAGVEAGGLLIFGTSAAVDIVDSTIAQNSGLFGGGLTVRNGGVVSITNCTFTGNSAKTGSAINEGIPPDAPPITVPPGTAIVQSSTIVANNSAEVPFRGRPIDSRGGPIKIRGTLLANNLPITTGDCPITATSLGFNLIRNPNATFTAAFGPPPLMTDCSAFLTSTDIVADPLLGPFVDEGAPGHGFFPLTEGSPAIDAGGTAPSHHPDPWHARQSDPQHSGPPSHPKPADCPATDQIGQPRRDLCDIGAIEFLPDRVTVRLAQFDSDTHVLFVAATSSAGRDHADLAVSVEGCLQGEPMLQLGLSYLFLRDVVGCGDLDKATVTVTSSRGGTASARIH